MTFCVYSVAWLDLKKSTPVVLSVIVADGLVIDDKNNRPVKLWGSLKPFGLGFGFQADGSGVDETCMGKDERGNRPVFEAALTGPNLQ